MYPGSKSFARYLFWKYFLSFFFDMGLNLGPIPRATPPARFCEGFFQDRILWTICQGRLWTRDSPISASCVVRITGVSHQCPAANIFYWFLAFLLDSSLFFFFPSFACKLAKLAVYCLSHTSSPFCSGYFGDGGLLNYLSGLALNHDPPDLSLPRSFPDSFWIL
jgi:hypothetical protein